MRAHLQNAFQSLLSFLLQIFWAVRISVKIQQESWNVVLSHSFGMIRSVSTHLTQTPSSSSSNWFIFILQWLLKRRDSLGRDNSHSQSLIKSRDISQSNDPGKTFSFGFKKEINNSNSTARITDKFAELDTMFSNFPNANSSIFSD